MSLSPTQKSLLQNAGWFDDTATETLTDAAGYFDVSIPLSLLLGFAEDYSKIVINGKHELIFTRSNTDANAVVQTPPADTNAEDYKITLTKIEWMMPYIKASDQRKIPLLNFISKDLPIAMSYRSWELYEYPMLPQAAKHVWVVKTSTQLEKPRYVIVGFQTARQNKNNKNCSNFDHCNIRDIKLFLNSQSYPYANLNLDIQHNQYALLYDMYANFQASYYGKESEPFLNKSDYLNNALLIVIDCSKQNDPLKSGPVHIRLEFEAVAPFPENTAAFCLILHDKIVEYTPISSNVKKLV